MMNVFDLRNELVGEYGKYTQSFINIRHEPLRSRVESEMARGALWPDPLLQLNPAYQPGGTVEDLVRRGELHGECAKIFRRKRDDSDPGTTLHLEHHARLNIQPVREAHRCARAAGVVKTLSHNHLRSGYNR